MGVLLTDELLDHFIVVPEHRLLFCYIEKNACTGFNELFMRVRHQAIHGADIWFKNTPAAHSLDKSDLEGLVVNESWHKAVFYREPLQRFVSAYVSKCVPGHDRERGHCEEAFGEAGASFARAVSRLRKDTNVHFLHQYRFCGGLMDTLRYYQTIEEIDDKINDKVQRLLDTVGVDDTTFDSSYAQRSKHITNASFYTRQYLSDPRHTALLLSHYAPDNFLFGIPAPLWAIRAYDATCLKPGHPRS